MFNRRNKFTLIELIVVIAVLGILSTIVIPNIKDMKTKAKVAAIESNVRGIQTSVDMFYNDFGYYPTNKQPVLIKDEDPTSPTFGERAVTKEEINFDKETFVIDYLRDEPKDWGVKYYVDGYGKVILEDESTSKPIGILKTSLVELTEKDHIVWEYENINNTVVVLNEKWILDGVESNTPPNRKLSIGKHKIELHVTYEAVDSEYQSPTEFVKIIDKEFEVTKFKYPQIGDVKEYLSYSSFDIIVDQEGIMYIKGSNTYGQLGLGHTMAINTFQKLDAFNYNDIAKINTKSSTTYILLKNGELYVSGMNDSGLLGLGISDKNYIVNEFTKIELFGDKKIKDIYVSSSTAFAITENGETYSWGSTFRGNSGTGFSGNSGHSNLFSPTIIPPTKTDPFVKVYEYWSTDNFYGLTENGNLYGWGWNGSGQLGLGTSYNENTAIKLKWFNDLDIKEIYYVGSFSYGLYALSNDGSLYYMGSNHSSQYNGIEHSEKVGTPKKINLPSKVVSLWGDGTDDIHVQLDDGRVYGWGENSNYELGVGDNQPRKTPVEIVELRGKKIEEYIIDYGSTFAILETGEVYGWGKNFSNKLGLSNGVVLTPQAVSLPSGTVMKELVSKNQSHSTFYLTEEGEVYCWGGNSYGELGGGSQTKPIPTFEGLPVKKIISYRSTTYFLLENGQLYVSGDYFDENGTKLNTRVPILAQYKK